jgi:hypothetical protein
MQVTGAACLNQKHQGFANVILSVDDVWQPSQVTVG